MKELLLVPWDLILFIKECFSVIAQSDLAFPAFGFLITASATFVKILIKGHDGVCGLDG